MTMTVKDALEQGARLPWALVRTLSSVSVGPTPARIEVDELLEARFFDTQKEIRIFRQEDELAASCLLSSNGIPEEIKLKKPFRGTLTACKLIDFDEDGQAYISAVMLCGWKED